MNWKTKSQLFRILSVIPAGESIYRLFQKHVTKSIVATPERVRQKMELADNYLRWLLANGSPADDIRSMRHIDFGAGWHPTIPLYYAMQGMRGQILLDLFPVLTARSFRESESLVASCCSDAHVPPLPMVSLPGVSDPNAGLDQLLRAYHMEYRAPYAEWAERSEAVADLVTSSQVLLHIDQPILDHCMKLIHRLLKPGGVFMAEVHLFDIYANSDPAISRFNHLQYSKDHWSNKVNSRLMSFNRLKSRDYREALERAGFEIVEFKVVHGSQTDLDALAKLDIHPEFLDRYTMAELSEVFVFFAARRK
jgi:hypothetical protein